MCLSSVFVLYLILYLKWKNKKRLPPCQALCDFGCYVFMGVIHSCWPEPEALWSRYRLRGRHGTRIMSTQTQTSCWTSLVVSVCSSCWSSVELRPESCRRRAAWWLWPGCLRSTSPLKGSWGPKTSLRPRYANSLFYLIRINRSINSLTVKLSTA